MMHIKPIVLIAAMAVLSMNASAQVSQNTAPSVMPSLSTTTTAPAYSGQMGSTSAAQPVRSKRKGRIKYSINGGASRTATQTNSSATAHTVDQRADLTALAGEMGPPAKTGLSIAPKAVAEFATENFSGEMGIVIELVKKGTWSAEFLARAGFVEFMGTHSEEKSKPFAAVTISSTDLGGYFKPYDHVSVTLKDISLNPGDTVDVVHADAPFSIEKKKAVVNHRVARGRVLSVDKAVAEIELLQVWGVVKNGDRLERAANFTVREVDTLLMPERVITTTIAAMVGDPAAVFLYNQFIIPQGLSDGVALGDIMAGRSSDKKELGKPTLVAAVINVQEKTSTLTVLKMFTDKIMAGDTVQTIKRIRFK